MENFEKFKSIDSKKEDMKQIKVFRVRHGSSKYKELTEETIDEHELDLTEEGRGELEKTAEHLTEVLDPKIDFVVVASSERRRAISSSNIIKNKLEEKGFLVWIDPKFEEKGRSRALRSKLNDMEIIDKDTEKVVPPLTEKYWNASGDVWKKHLGEKPKIPAKDVYKKWFNREMERLEGEKFKSESSDEVRLRSQNHLAFLMKVARRFQPRLSEDGKKLVIIEVEHGETLDNLTEELGQSGLGHGGFFELGIPVDGTEINIKKWEIGDENEKEIGAVNFDSKKREFIKKQNK